MNVSEREKSNFQPLDKIYWLLFFSPALLFVLCNFYFRNETKKKRRALWNRLVTKYICCTRKRMSLLQFLFTIQCPLSTALFIAGFSFREIKLNHLQLFHELKDENFLNHMYQYYVFFKDLKYQFWLSKYKFRLRFPIFLSVINSIHFEIDWEKFSQRKKRKILEKENFPNLFQRGCFLAINFTPSWCVFFSSYAISMFTYHPCMYVLGISFFFSIFFLG